LIFSKYDRFKANNQSKDCTRTISCSSLNFHTKLEVMRLKNQQNISGLMDSF